MPYTCTLDGRIVRVCWQGMITQDDLASFGKEMPRIGRQLGFAPDVLHSFDGSDGVGFEPAAAYHYSVQQRQITIPNPIRSAQVVSSKESEYIATVFSSWNRTPNLEMKVFFDEASALRWLARE